MLLLIERVAECLEAVAAPVTTAVANNSEKPGPPIAAGKCPKVSKGPQRRLLHGIFRIVLIPHEPARQPMGGVEMGQDDLGKISPIAGVGAGRQSPLLINSPPNTSRSTPSSARTAGSPLREVFVTPLIRDCHVLHQISP